MKIRNGYWAIPLAIGIILWMVIPNSVWADKQFINHTGLSTLVKVFASICIAGGLALLGIKYFKQ